MAGNTAEEKYDAFENLRNRFGGSRATKAAGSRDVSRTAQLQQGKSKRRPGSGRPDPRANAPPLVPLVEEDSTADGMYDDTPLVIGKWKFSNTIKSNHLNGPDFDALETASVASCSSAYSSRSESSLLSPPCGSATELSDAGSCDTFMEYDLLTQRKHKLRLQHLHAGKLKTNLHTENDEQIKFPWPPPDLDIPDNFVTDHVKVWNDVIGEWRFEGVSPVPSPSSPPAYKVTNEVRVPTPVWTPQGSTDNLLLDSESRSSLLSSEDEMTSSSYSLLQERRPHPLGRSIRSHSTTSLTTSTLQSAANIIEGKHARSLSDLVRVEGGAQEGEGEREGGEEGQRKGEQGERKGEQGGGVQKCEEVKSKKSAQDVTDKVAKPDENKHTDKDKRSDKDKHAAVETNPKVVVSANDSQSITTPQARNLPKVKERIKLLRRHSMTDLHSSTPKPVTVDIAPAKPSKWLEAYNKSKALKTVQESQGSEVEEVSTRTETSRMKVTQRAQIFGETKKCLQRKKSFAMGDTRGF